jgi:succinoglycan biosynthesis transport protein ExoP
MRESVPYSPEYIAASIQEKLSIPHDFPAKDAADVREYWRVIVRRRRLIAMVLLSAVLATAVVVFSMQPIYTAETTLLIERKAPQAIDLAGATVEAQGPDEYDYYRTQYEILKSRQLITQVIQEQQLDKISLLFKGPQQSRGLRTTLLSRIGDRIARTFSPMGQTDKTEGDSSADEFTTNGENSVSIPGSIQDDETAPLPHEMIAEYLSMLEIKPVPRTRLVKITFSTPDPALSARTANAHAQTYIRQGVERRSRTDEEAQGFLEDKLVEVRARLEKSEAALNTYRREHGILSFDEKENTALDRLADLNKNLTEAEARRIELEAQLSLIHQKTHDALPSVIESPFIQSLKEELVRVEAEHAQLLSQFKVGYPRVQELEAKILDIRSRLRQEVRRIVESITVSYRFAASKEEQLRKKMEQQKALVLGLKDASVKYAILAREVDTNRQLYDNILQRIKEVGIVAESRDSNISVIDEATAPLQPSKPRKALSLLLSAIVGLMGGVGLTFFLEYLDNTLQTPEEAERFLRLPNLAVVPDFARAHALEEEALEPLFTDPGARTLNGGERPGAMGSFNGVNGKSQKPGELILDHHTFSPMAESYRTLRLGILLSRADEAPKVILFTSAAEGEGKTSTVINTAITFAQLGMRTLLIDCDLRRPRCHKALGVDNGVGLTEYLTGQRDVRQVIKPTTVHDLYFLSSGVTPPNPAELLASRKMRDTLHLLRQEYDSILIDSPPVMPVSEPLLLSTIVDGVVLVVNGQKTPRDIVREARSRLGQVRANILGSVLNRVDIRRNGYGYYYGYHAAPSGRDTAHWQESDGEIEIGD